MPARKRIQGQQRRLRKYLRTQAQAYEQNPSILDEREKELERSLAKLDEDLAKLTSSDDVPPSTESEEKPTDDAPESEAELKQTQIKRLTQMRSDMASLLAVNKRIRQSLTQWWFSSSCILRKNDVRPHISVYHPVAMCLHYYIYIVFDGTDNMLQLFTGD